MGEERAKFLIYKSWQELGRNSLKRVVKCNPLNSLLENPSDEPSTRVTDTRRKVLKISKNHGTNKYSRTEYPNGSYTETHSHKN